MDLRPAPMLIPCLSKTFLLLHTLLSLWAPTPTARYPGSATATAPRTTTPNGVTGFLSFHVHSHGSCQQGLWCYVSIFMVGWVSRACKLTNH
jgi:hypothetical protein